MTHPLLCLHVCSELRFLTPDMLAMNKHVWADANRTVFVASLQENLGNIWYYSSRVLPLYTMKVRVSCRVVSCQPRCGYCCCP